MSGFRVLLSVMMLYWSCGALCAEEGNKANQGTAKPDAAARDTATHADDSHQASGTTALEGRRADQPAEREIPDDLGNALSLALSQNPQLRVAEAKVRQAQAEYDQVSLSVVHDVTLAFREYAKEKEAVVPSAAKRAHAENLERAKAKLMYVLGIETRLETKPVAWKFEFIHEPEKSKSKAARQPGSGGAPPSGETVPSPSAAMREALEETTDFDFTDQPLSDVLDYLAHKHGPHLQFLFGEGGNKSQPVTANLHAVTVRAGLQAIADLTGTCFVFRDYGILITHDSEEIRAYRASDVPMIAPAIIDQVIGSGAP